MLLMNNERIGKLTTRIGELEAMLETLQAEVATLRTENAMLRARLEDKTPPTAPPAFVKANKPTRESKEPRKKRDSKHNRARRREQATRHETRRLESCPDCGDRLAASRPYYKRQVIDIPEPVQAEVVEIQVEKSWCARCRRYHWPAVDWKGVVDGRGRIGVRLMGLIGYLRTHLRLPVRLIQEYVHSLHGVRLSGGEISALCQRLATRLTPEAEALKAAARSSPVVHMDETGWREDGRNGYIWCLVTDVPQPVRYYEFHFSRAGAVATTLLGEFNGFLVSDFYAGYNAYSGAHQRCWVHLLRDLRDLRLAHADNGAVIAWARAVELLYRTAVAPSAEATEGMTDVPRQLYDRLWQQANVLGLQYAQAKAHPCQALAKRVLRHIDELFQFLRCSELHPDNNLAERSLRPLVVQRKVSGGSRSPAGSKTRMTLASLFATWHARKQNELFTCWNLLGYQLTPMSGFI